MKAIGYTSKGERKEFKVDSNGYLYCSNRDLISLDIPEGVKFLWCRSNKLTELNIPESVKLLICDRHVLGLDNIDWDCKIRLH